VADFTLRQRAVASPRSARNGLRGPVAREIGNLFLQPRAFVINSFQWHSKRPGRYHHSF